MSKSTAFIKPGDLPDEPTPTSDTYVPAKASTPSAPASTPETPVQSAEPAKSEVQTQAPEIVEPQTTTLAEAKAVLAQGAEEEKKAPKGTPAPTVNVAGTSIDAPKETLSKIDQAIRLVKKYLPSFLPLDLNKVVFEQLEGCTVGRATADQIKISPNELMQPVSRLAAIIFHETAHADNEIQNEGLVQHFTEKFFGKMNTVADYQTAVNNFDRFAQIFSKGTLFNRGGDANKGVYKIYELYFKGLKDPKYFEQIYDTFMGNSLPWLNKKEFKTREEATAFFNQVFPELKFTDDKAKKISLDYPAQPPNDPSLANAANDAMASVKGAPSSLKLSPSDMNQYLPAANEQVINESCADMRNTVEDWANAFPGFSEFMKNLANSNNKDKLAEAILSYIRFQGIMTSKYKPEGKFRRLDEATLNNAPVSAPGHSAKEFMNQLNSAIKQLVSAYNDPILNGYAEKIFTTDPKQKLVDEAFVKFGERLKLVIKKDNGATMIKTIKDSNLIGMPKALSEQGVDAILNIMRTTNNQEEFKSCLTDLASRGQIKWDDTEIWKNMNRFVKPQYAIPLTKNEKTKTDFHFLQTAIDSIWGINTFNSLYSQNKANFESKAKEFAEKGRVLGTDDREKYLNELSKRKGFVDPQEIAGLKKA